ncbi:MAG: hypothetical protein K6U00_12010 [Armatimonadetes bacterium]|nr:hypothetical protein [Armatimonadota bacterium]
MQLRGSQKILLALWAISATVVVGCGGGGGGGSEPTPQPINNPPTITLVSPPSNPIAMDVTTQQYLDLKIKADDKDGDRLTCVWTRSAGSVSPTEYEMDAGSEMTARFTPPQFDGQCKLQVTVSDGETSATKEIIVNVTGWNTNPGSRLSITSITMTPDPVSPSATAQIVAQVSNPSGQALTYTWKSKYGAFSGTGSTVRWTAPKTPGVYGIYLAVTDGTTTVTAGKAVMVAGPAGGLQGDYYLTYRDRNYVRFDKLVFSRIDPTVNFNWEKLSPAPDKIPGDGWGARWKGFVKCEQPGTYIFRVHVDDGARMRIQNDSGQWVYVIPDTKENWSDHTEGAWLPDPVVPIQLEGGKWYPIELDFFEGAADAFIDLYWSVNGGPETIIPQTSLKPPT